MATKTIPAWIQENYPEWKVMLFRVVRAFIGGFLGAMVLFIEKLDFAQLDSEENIKKILLALLAGAVAGGVTAVGKAIRLMFPDVAWIQKLPF